MWNTYTRHSKINRRTIDRIVGVYVCVSVSVDCSKRDRRTCHFRTGRDNYVDYLRRNWRLPGKFSRSPVRGNNVAWYGGVSAWFGATETTTPGNARTPKKGVREVVIVRLNNYRVTVCSFPNYGLDYRDRRNGGPF